MSAPLRAIDWRFLLPAPSGWRARRAAILGGEPGVVARAICEQMAAEVMDRLPGDGPVDLIAMLPGATHDLRAIAAALTDDGVLYLALPPGRHSRDSLAGTTRNLQAAGLTIAARYLVEPGHGDARAYVPLDAPHTLEWHRRVDRPNPPGARLARHVRAAAERLMPPLVAHRRSLAIVATRTPHDSPLPAVLQDPAVRSATGQPIHAAVMQAYGGDRVIFFPFAAAAREPMTVVKVPKTRGLAGRTVHEQVETRALRAVLSPELRAAIPEPLGIVSVHDMPVASERYVPGVRLTTLAMSDRRPLAAKARDLALGIEWLARFHRATETARPPLDEIATEWILRPHDHLARACPLGAAEQALLERARAAGDALGARPVPIARQHRDFAVWNLLVTDERRLAVVDWEGTREGPGVIDAIHLVTTWLYACRLGRGDDDEPRSVRDVFAATPAPGRETAVARAALERYADEVGLDRSLLPLAIVTHRVELALRRLEQARLHSVGTQSVELPEIATVRLLAGVSDPFSVRPVP